MAQARTWAEVEKVSLKVKCLICLKAISSHTDLRATDLSAEVNTSLVLTSPIFGRVSAKRPRGGARLEPSRCKFPDRPKTTGAAENGLLQTSRSGRRQAEGEAFERRPLLVDEGET